MQCTVCKCKFERLDSTPYQGFPLERLSSFRTALSCLAIKSKFPNKYHKKFMTQSLTKNKLGSLILSKESRPEFSSQLTDRTIFCHPTQVQLFWEGKNSKLSTYVRVERNFQLMR